jgi:hypothetical protein
MAYWVKLGDTDGTERKTLTLHLAHENNIMLPFVSAID